MRDRGYLFQCTNLDALDESMMKDDTFSAYLGFDATADSLHVGSLLQIMILRHLQKSGCRPVVLVGGATSKVGDPTGKDESRKMLTDEAIATNVDGISKVFEKFLTFGDEKVREGRDEGGEGRGGEGKSRATTIFASGREGVKRRLRQHNGTGGPYNNIFAPSYSHLSIPYCRLPTPSW